MSSLYRTCYFCVALLLLFSCNIEKRQYRSGYYISSPRAVKNNPAEKAPPADLLPDSRAVAENEKHADPAEEKITGISILPATSAYLTEEKIPSISKNTVPVSVSKTDLKKQTAPEPAPRDDEKIKKDVKGLLLSSLAVFFLSLLYGIFSLVSVPLMTKIIFVIAPFSIIGIWIFALLLKTKYSTQDSNATEVKQNEERIITRKRAFLLAGFLGIFGAHRFYLGYTEIGILEMFTLGGFFILYFIDLLRIKIGKLKPKNGDYAPEGTPHIRPKKNTVPNKSLKLIRLALMISILALIVILGFAIFF